MRSIAPCWTGSARTWLEPTGVIDFDVRTLPAGDGRWWCVHPARFDATSFHPNVDGDPADESIGGRFHPFDDGAGRRVGTRYLADHPDGAFAETLLRDGVSDRLVTAETVAMHRLAQIGLRRELRVADLTNLDPDSPLRAALQQDTDAYPQLRIVAATLHADAQRLDGVVWEGRQLETPGMECVVLFDDRVSGESDLATIQSLDLERGVGSGRLRAAARLRGYLLPSARSVHDRRADDQQVPRS